KIKAVIAELATYGYRRVPTPPPPAGRGGGVKNPQHQPLLPGAEGPWPLPARRAWGGARPPASRAPPGVSQTQSCAARACARRWCSYRFEIGCDNGERVRVVFVLDCCDREAMSFLATTGGIAGEDVRDLMVAAVEYRFGQVNRLPVTIEWLSDNGSCYVAGDT